MFNELFQSLQESIKKRNTPDNYVIDNSIPSSDVIHRGYLRGDVEFPLRYDFIPDNSSYRNAGRHIYHFKNEDVSGIIEIDHKYKPTNSGHETSSSVYFHGIQGSLPRINIHRLLIPTLNHHIKSHDPDVINFKDNVPFPDDMIERLGSNFEGFIANGKAIAKKKLDPKIGRIVSHIKNKLNSK
jgi:hypothetical protein